MTFSNRVRTFVLILNICESMLIDSVEFTKIVWEHGLQKKKRQEKEIDETVDTINSTAQLIRKQLQHQGYELSKNTAPKEGEDRIKNNIHITLLEDFLDLVQSYQSIQNHHNEEMRKLFKSQVLIVDPKATDEDVDRAIEHGPQIIFASDRTKAIHESLSYFQNKQTEIMKLEKSLEEVHQLFVDMSVLVQEQSETVKRIASQVSSASDHISAATQDLLIAERTKRRGHPRCMVQ